MAKVGDIKKELRALIRDKKAEVPNLSDKEGRKIVQKCREEINKKYGHGWRFGNTQQSDRPCDDPTSPYYGHENGEFWMD